MLSSHNTKHCVKSLSKLERTINAFTKHCAEKLSKSEPLINGPTLLPHRPHKRRSDEGGEGCQGRLLAVNTKHATRATSTNRKWDIWSMR